MSARGDRDEPPHFALKRRPSPDRRSYRDKDRDRSRSPVRDRDRERHRHRDRSRSRSVDKNRDRDRDTYSDRRRERSPARSTRRSRSRSIDRDKRRERRRSVSSEASSRRHKHRGRSRSRSRSRSVEKDRKRKDRSREKRRRSRSTSGSEESSDEDRKRHKKRKDKHRKRSHSRERKERKKEKKEKKKKKHGLASGGEWGKHGIISETDIFTKDQEFRAWLVEERMLNPETMSKDQTKKEFARFVEDFNTATLPHEKFYHMEAYEKRMNALRSGDYIPPPEDSYDPTADMRDLQSKHKRTVVEHESYLNKDQLQQLRRVQQERIEAGKMKLLGMDIKQNMGVRMDGTKFDNGP